MVKRLIFGVRKIWFKRQTFLITACLAAGWLLDVRGPQSLLYRMDAVVLPVSWAAVRTRCTYNNEHSAWFTGSYQ